jgi:hypothetical protein
MTPIVNGLQEEFGETVSFVYLDARDNADGQRYFESLELPGHPSILIFDSSKRETYRTFGVVEVEALRQAIVDAG